jgi:putative SOS response-associated peptidase YedK
MFIVPRGAGPMAFAGLWEQWQGKVAATVGSGPEPGAGMLPFGEEAGGAAQTTVESFTIITTDVNSDLRPIHDRMPAVLAPGDYARWLDPAVAATEAGAMLRPYPDGLLRAYPVSPRVNSPKVDDASCCAEIEMGHDRS